MTNFVDVEGNLLLTLGPLRGVKQLGSMAESCRSERIELHLHAKRDR